MITEEEKNEIINAAVERTLMAIPEVVGNLMANHAMLHKLNKDFFDKYKEFAGKRDIVQSVVEAIEGQNPTLKYEDILEKSVPEIRRRIAITQEVNTTDIAPSIPKDFSNGVI